MKTPKRNCIRQRSTSVNQDEATSLSKDAAEPEKEESDREEEATLAVMDEYRTPKWLTQIQPTRSPYLPQISDKIYYFVQGHMDYVNSEHCPPEAHKTQPWEQMRERTFRHAEPCKVLSLAFLTGPPTLCQVCWRKFFPFKHKVVSYLFGTFGFSISGFDFRIFQLILSSYLKATTSTTTSFDF